MNEPVLSGSPALPDSSLAQPAVSSRSLDITRLVCPMTFVRVRLALDQLDPGETLLVRLQGEEPVRNVPRTAAELGHHVLSLTPQDDGTHLLLLRRG